MYTWKASLPMESYIHLSHANNPLLILWLYIFLLCLSPALHLFFHLTRISSPVVQFFFFLSYLQDSFCFHFVVFLCKISRAVILLCIFNLDIIYINFLTRSHDLQSKQKPKCRNYDLSPANLQTFFFLLSWGMYPPLWNICPTTTLYFLLLELDLFSIPLSLPYFKCLTLVGSPFNIYTCLLAHQLFRDGFPSRY